MLMEEILQTEMLRNVSEQRLCAQVRQIKLKEKKA